MRILHVLDHSIPLHSGYAFRTLSILKEQRALGWDTFHLTSPKQGPVSILEEEVDGWCFFRTAPRAPMLAQAPGVKEIALMRDLADRMLEIARRIEPDILHAHSPVLNAIPALRVGRRLGIPVVYEVRASWEDAAVDHGTAKPGGFRYRASRALETWALKRADAVTTICEGLRKEIVARGIPPSKVNVIPNAVDVQSFRLAEAADAALRRELGLEGMWVLGFAGSFYAYEGLELLLRAFPSIVSAVPNARVLLVGGGRQEHFLRQLVSELALDGRVIFTGRVPHADVERYYEAVDVFVYPRLSMRLTEMVTPLKPLEAMAKGRLVVASDVGGHRELIRDGVTGTLFKAGDASALASAVLELQRHSERWPVLRANARRFVERERTWRSSVAQYRRVYEAVLKQTHACAAT